MKERYYGRVIGRVQGVGFRYFVCQLAARYELTGWVRNCLDGSVDMDASRRVVFKFRMKDAEMIDQMSQILEGQQGD